ncbi:MAG: methionine synthase, partial [Planctomycetota bacterium]
GTTPAHLAAVVEAVGGRRPAERRPAAEPASSSIYQAIPHRQDNSFLIVGERCNTNGSRKFKRLLAEGDLDGLVEVAVEQVRGEGAHVIDVCVDYVGRDGVPDMQAVIDRFAREVTAPLMLDSTQPDVLEAGLKLAGGKCIINSVNLEDGEERLGRIAGLARQFGAALVALTIDEDPQEAMGKTCARKLEIARRIHRLLTERHGIAEEDIFFDCLTFPITTGNPDDRRLGLETLDAIEALMNEFPNCQSILGLSNISFGLQPAARVVLNSVYLHEARARGLTAAIVHAGKILPRNQISDERWDAAQALIYDRRDAGDPLEHFIGLFGEDEKIGDGRRIEELPLEERLKQRIIDGQRQGLEDDLEAALEKYEPLEIINTLLLDGMRVVGELFGSGQMQLPFVLKSAETMKAAVAHLEPKMDKVEGRSRGRLVLATVRGDVHDIGKNLVDIIVSNNGYTVYNLGIKQPINNVLEAVRKHKADAIGLSGLLVKSTIVMRDDLIVLNEQGVRIPVMLGGAALTRRYVEEDLRKVYEGPVYYAKDAFEGLELMGRIMEGKHAVEAAAEPVEEDVSEAPAAAARRDLEQLDLDRQQRYGLRPVDEEAAASEQPAEAPAATAVAEAPRSDITHTHPVPRPPFWGSRVLQQIPLRAVLAYINETMLFQVQWGFRRKGRSPEQWRKYVATEVRPHYRDLVARCEQGGILRPQAIYGFWPCHSDGDALIVYEPPRDAGAPPEEHGPELMRFEFPRQSKSPHWCLSDFWRPIGDAVDVVAFQIVTAGPRVSEIAREWFARDEYQQYLFLHGLGVETAEALAEYIHKQIRADLRIGRHDARDLQALFKQGYQGSRYSFGYPACPRLEDQARLIELLRADRIHISLTDEYQLDPEQSTSAIVTYHPAARYFSVR